MYDLLVFSVKYEAVIDAMTGDRLVRMLRKSELEPEEWKIIPDLVSVLKVSHNLVDETCTNNYARSSRMRQHSFHGRISPVSQISSQQWMQSTDN